MPKNFRHILKESIDDMDWIRDVKTTNLDFNFDGKEYWVDVSKIDIEGRKKIANYIKKTIPNYTEFVGGELDDISRGNNKGVIIHCGSDRTDFEPEENLMCYSDSSYQDDYEIDNPYADISKSIYIDGQEILDYLSVADDEEELDESLEWSDKDEPFDEKDKSFENDPSWKDDEDWELNPERSYWKQGDAGGSGGGDVNESEEDPLKWIKDVEPIKLLVWTDRKKKKKEIDLDAKKLRAAVSSGHDNDWNWNINDIESQLNNGDGEGTTKIDRYHGGGSDTVYWALNESEEDPLKWVKDVKADPLTASPDVFFRDDDEMYYTIGELGHDTTNMEEFTMCELAINYGYRWSEEHEGWYHRDEVADFVNGNFPKGVRRGLDESDELDWIRDVSDQVPRMSSRKKIDLKDFIIELVKDSYEYMEVLQMLINLDLFTPSDKYIHETGNNGEGFTPEEYDDFGVTNWLEGDWLGDGNSVWHNEPSLAYGEINELLNQVNGHEWVLEDWHTNDYNLEYGTYQDRYIFKNSVGGSYFALDFGGSSYDGIAESAGYLYQVFPKNVTKLVYESKLIKRVIKEEVEDIDIAYEDDNLVVIHPKTQEASCRYGNDTRWCTSAEGGEAYDEYNSSGNLYYYMWKFKMPPKLQNFQKIARLIGYGKEYGEIGEFFLFDDATMTPHDILFNILEGKNGDNGFTYPSKLKPLNESWERALIAVDTHYAKNGLHKAPSEYNNDDDYDEDDMGGFGGELLDY